MTKEKIKENIIVLDWNGCLLDDFFVAYTAMNRILEAHGRKEVTEDEYRAKFNMPFSKLYESFGFDVIPENGQEIYGATVKELNQKAALRKGVLPFLDICKNYNITPIIVSNSRCESIHAKLAENGPDIYIKDIIGIDHPQHNSTNKSDNLASYLGGKDVSISCVGDTFEEIDMAKRFKGTSVAITGGYISSRRLLNKGPDFVVDNFSELGNAVVQGWLFNSKPQA
jgi:phosphoglycolate phosphatase-like HAD superfamily hydrolase